MMHRKTALFLFTAFCFVAVYGCSQSISSNNILQTASEVTVLGQKSEEANAFCKDFSLNGQQALTFFNRSKFIDAKAMHDDYDYLPCYVYGTLRYKNETCNWEIRAGGTGIIKCPGQEYIIACNNCDELLKD